MNGPAMRPIIVAAFLVAACTPTAPPRATTVPPDDGARSFRDRPPDPIGAAAPGSRTCNQNDDCGAGEQCFAPDFVPGRGAAPQCQSDAHCGPDSICSGGLCSPRCKIDQCGVASRCAANGHCEPLPCNDSHAPACPQNHRCDRVSGVCMRMACSSSSACDLGPCWQGRCFLHGGFCMNRNYCCPP